MTRGEVLLALKEHTTYPEETKELVDSIVKYVEGWDTVIYKIKVLAAQIQNPDTINGLAGALNIIEDVVGGVFSLDDDDLDDDDEI